MKRLSHAMPHTLRQGGQALRDAALVERNGGRPGHTLGVVNEMLRALSRADREVFAAELAAYLSPALVAAVVRRGGAL